MKALVKSFMLLILLFTSNGMGSFSFKKMPKKLTAYYSASIQPLEELQEKLNDNNFTILSITEVLKEKIVITITNKELKSTNSYMATLQLLVNYEDHEIRIQNPSYLGAAYLKQEYYYGKFKQTLNSLEDVLGTMSEVKERYTFNALSTFQFMYGLPFFKDTLIIEAEENPFIRVTESPHIAYTLELPNGSILVGHKFKMKSNNFLKVIHEEKNAQLFPYESMIQDGEVTILDPKYYLTLSLPLLNLERFLKIATAPDTIKREISKAYK